ncbi:MAG TPA: pyridoxamine 5'-phosphate oxidase family protein [Coleofasciculaceae cyanobacterium]
MADELKRFLELIKGFDTAILVTHADNNRLHGRPMAVVDVEENGDLWFLTGEDTPKTGEIRSNDHVLVTFQDGRDRFVSITGRAELIRDRQKVDELWKESFKVWFPEGKEDPNLSLIHVRAQEGEYWDHAGANKMTYMLESVRALAAGETPRVREGEQHGRVQV